MITKQLIIHLIVALAGLAVGAGIAAIAVLAFGAPRGVVDLYAVAFGATAVICGLEWLRREQRAVRS